MYTLILPISGGGFVNQLGILQHLCEVNFKPDLTLASSGGNVAAYIASAANWKWSAIERISRELSQDLFVKKWSSIPTMAILIGFFKGNSYNKGNGVKDFLNKYFTEKTITNYEIWTGTYNQTHQKCSIFCNRSQDDSIIDASSINHHLVQSCPPVYADGNIDLIASVGIASASIPALVPEEVIDGEHHSDGGVGGSSPIMQLYEPILEYTQTSETPLHLIYVNSIDLSLNNTKDYLNVMDNWRQATQNVIKSQMVIDRFICFQLLKSKGTTIKHVTFKCNYQNLKKLEHFRYFTVGSLLEIYPEKTENVNLSKFCGNDIIKCIRTTYDHCHCRFWWVDIPSHSESIKNIISSFI